MFEPQPQILTSLVQGGARLWCVLKAPPGDSNVKVEKQALGS